MTNDPRDLDGKRLQAALYRLGRYPAARGRLIEFLKEIENELDFSGSVREEITGPIVDALHDDADVYEKNLKDGTRFEFLFRTKIARDFLMSKYLNPSHVWEPQTTKLLLSLASKISGDVIVGGAYFGDQAILVAKNMRPSGKFVHCFEPNIDQSQMLMKNVEINELSNVRVNRVGLWSVSNVNLRLEGFDSFANVIESEDADESFPTITIDDYQSQLGLEVGLIQLDIEGAELPALKGSLRTLSKDKPYVIFEVNRSYVDWSNGLRNTDICRFLLDLGYTIFAIRDFNTHYEMIGLPIELIPLDRIYLEGPPHGFNMLAIQKPSELSTDEFRIVEGVSPKLLAHKSPDLHHPMSGL